MDPHRQKKDDGRLWRAVDRAAKSVLGWTLGDRGTETAQRLAAPLPDAPHLKFASDFWHPYGKIFAGQNHVQGKAHTFMIESLNNRIRCHLARLKRKTHRYTKSKANLAASILLFLVRQCGGEPVAQSLPIPVWQSRNLRSMFATTTAPRALSNWLPCVARSTWTTRNPRSR